MLIGLLSFSQGKVAPKKDNLLFMLRQTEHINQALKTIEDLHTGKDSKLNVGDIVIIVCGQAVESLTGNEAKEWVAKTSKYKCVSILACGLSLDKFKKSKDELVPGVKYTRNGFIKAFELQKQGYLSVEL